MCLSSFICFIVLSVWVIVGLVMFNFFERFFIVWGGGVRYMVRRIVIWCVDRLGDLLCIEFNIILCYMDNVLNGFNFICINCEVFLFFIGIFFDFG